MKLHGAVEVVATDVVDEALARAKAVGADTVINVAKDPAGLEPYAKDKGRFDIVVEASGNQAALNAALDVIKPRGRLVQLGLGGDVTISQNQLVAKEIELCGSFRFHEEFAWAVAWIGARRIALSELLTGVYPISDAASAFEAAGDRNQSMKVQISVCLMHRTVDTTFTARWQRRFGRRRRCGHIFLARSECYR